MTVSTNPSERSTAVSPVIDYEPPVLSAAVCQSTTPLRSRGRRAQRALGHTGVRRPAPPRTAVMFADAALRRVLEVIDRRRPVAQLRPWLAPALTDTVIALTRSPRPRGAARSSSGATSATLRRLRVRMVESTTPLDDPACEVFGTYTRGPRVLAIAARIELHRDRWRLTALQIG